MSQLLARFGVKDHDRPAIEFVVKIVSVYAVWKIFQFTVDHIPALLSIWQKGTDFYAHKIATLANKIFVAMGYDVSFYYYKAVFIIGTPGFMVEEHCIAIPATLIFGAFIAIYKGPIKHKYWYIPLGMIAVQATGCAPIVKAFENNAEHAELWPNAHTIASGIRVPAAIGDFLILRAVRESGGFAVSVTDEAIMNALER